jgi:translocator protein
MKKEKFLKLLGIIIVCQIFGSLGSIFTIPNIPTWYAGLTKPFFNPPNWLFAPAWTILFLLMGISLYIILESGVEKNNQKNGLKKKAIIFFIIQFFFNFLWSLLFFGLKNPLLGFIGILILIVFIVLTIIYFYKINKTAAYLLIPYIAWVCFATILNFSILLLNM